MKLSILRCFPAHIVQREMNQSDDSQREKQAMEHQDTATVEKEIRGVGNNGLSSMRAANKLTGDGNVTV